MRQHGKLGVYTQRGYFPVCGVKVGGSGKKEGRCAIWVYGTMNRLMNRVTNPPRRESTRQRLFKCRYQRRAPDAHPTPGPVQNFHLDQSGSLPVTYCTVTIAQRSGAAACQGASRILDDSIMSLKLLKTKYD
jgi:hypothetical protein